MTTIKQLIEKLSKYDDNMLIVAYNSKSSTFKSLDIIGTTSIKSITNDISYPDEKIGVVVIHV